MVVLLPNSYCQNPTPSPTSSLTITPTPTLGPTICWIWCQYGQKWASWHLFPRKPRDHIFDLSLVTFFFSLTILSSQIKFPFVAFSHLTIFNNLCLTRSVRTLNFNLMVYFLWTGTFKKYFCWFELFAYEKGSRECLLFNFCNFSFRGPLWVPR